MHSHLTLALIGVAQGISVVRFEPIAPNAPVTPDIAARLHAGLDKAIAAANTQTAAKAAFDGK